jgi:hypothetical protein
MKQEPLFDLIFSLTMSEKRFFKIFSQRHVIGDENDYSKLFDFIDKEPNVDNSILIEQDFVKNVSAEKNYLYRLILKSLNAFHSQNSDKRKIYDYLISIDILFQKGLYSQAVDLVLKARKLANKNELLRQELLLSELHEELLLKDQKYGDVVNLINEDKHLLDLVENLLSLKELTTKGYHENLSKGVIRNEKDLEPFNALINNELVKDEKNALTKRARLHQISVQLTYNMVAGNNDMVLKYVQLIIAHYEANQHLINHTPIGYVSCYFILGNAQLADKKHDLVFNTTKAYSEIEQIDSVRKSQKALSSAFFYKNILLFQLGKIDDLELIESEIPKHIPFIGKAQLYDLYFQLSLSFFYQKNYKKALWWSNEILNDSKFKSRGDFMNTIKLFNLLIHFELGNDFTLEYISKSTSNYLKKKNRLYEVEKLLIKFLTKHENYITNKSVNKELQKLSTKLKICKSDKYEVKAFQYFDYLNWVESKLKE